MMKTLDGGKTWTAWAMGKYAANLVDTYWTSPETGWVVGGRALGPVPSGPLKGPPPASDWANIKPVVLYTNDGGKTWDDRVLGMADQFPLGEWGWKIHFRDRESGYVSLENFSAGAILKTTDGGRTWARVVVNDPQKNVELQAVGFIDENVGWVGGLGTADDTGGFSSVTYDGGESWQGANDIGLFLNRFRFFGSPVTLGYAAGKTVYKYSKAAPAGAFAGAAVLTNQVLETSEPQDASPAPVVRFTVPPGVRHLTLDFWDKRGVHVVRNLDETAPAAGPRTVVWDHLDDTGAPVPGGLYIYRVTADDTAESGMVQLPR
jgi:hypothetical protein